MAVTYDNSAVVQGFGVTTLTTGSFTITSTADRAALVGLNHIADPGTISSVSCGGQSGTIISGTTLTVSGATIRLYGVTAPASGSQTASASWTNSVNAAVHAETASGVDQTTPFNGGTSVGPAFASSQNLSVTSTSGDLTATFDYCSAVDSAQTSNQTQRTTGWACMDTGPGTGTTTHTWSHSATNMGTVGANFVAAGAGGGAASLPPFRVGMPQAILVR